MSRSFWTAFGCAALTVFVLGFWLNPLIAAVLGVVSLLMFAALIDWITG